MTPSEATLDDVWRQDASSAPRRGGGARWNARRRLAFEIARMSVRDRARAFQRALDGAATLTTSGFDDVDDIIVGERGADDVAGAVDRAQHGIDAMSTPSTPSLRGARRDERENAGGDAREEVVAAPVADAPADTAPSTIDVREAFERARCALATARATVASLERDRAMGRARAAVVEARAAKRLDAANRAFAALADELDVRVERVRRTPVRAACASPHASDGADGSAVRSFSFNQPSREEPEAEQTPTSRDAVDATPTVADALRAIDDAQHDLDYLLRDSLALKRDVTPTTLKTSRTDDVVARAVALDRVAMIDSILAVLESTT